MAYLSPIEYKHHETKDFICLGYRHVLSVLNTVWYILIKHSLIDEGTQEYQVPRRWGPMLVRVKIWSFENLRVLGTWSGGCWVLGNHKSTWGTPEWQGELPRRVEGSMEHHSSCLMHFLSFPYISSFSPHYSPVS